MGDYVRVIVTDPADATQVARRLRVAALDQPHLIRTSTEGTGLAFVVPREFAERAGFLTPPDPAISSPAVATADVDDRPTRKSGRRRKGDSHG